MNPTPRKFIRSHLINGGLSASWTATTKASHCAERAIIGIARWATTDHTGFSRALTRMPNLGVWDTIKYVFIHFIATIVAILLTGLLVFLIIAFGIPYLITGSLH